LTQRAWVQVPGCGRHVAKITERMYVQGCIRSPRHLRNGACPSLSAATRTDDDGATSSEDPVT
jgi:hypothetical protein